MNRHTQHDIPVHDVAKAIRETADDQAVTIDRAHAEDNNVCAALVMLDDPDGTSTLMRIVLQLSDINFDAARQLAENVRRAASTGVAVFCFDGVNFIGAPTEFDEVSA